MEYFNQHSKAASTSSLISNQINENFNLNQTYDGTITPTPSISSNNLCKFFFNFKLLLYYRSVKLS